MKDSVKKFLLAVIYAVIVVNIQHLFGPLITELFSNKYASSLVSEAIFAVFAIAGAILFHKTDELKITFKGFSDGIIAGLPIFVMYTLILIFEILVHLGTFTASTYEVMMYAMDMLLVGITEEVLFRAVIQNLAMDCTGKDRVNAIRKGILLSGTIFGLIHLLNIFVGVSIVSAIDQAIMAVVMGVITGAIYFRSKNNLLLIILMHALIDFTSLLGSGGLSGVSTIDSINEIGSGGYKRLIALALYTGIAVYLMRRSAIGNAIEDFNN